jgi:hypothetical protein
MPEPGPGRGLRGTRVTHFLRASTTTLACALLVSACGSESKISATQLKSLVLARQDLPAQFQAFAEGPTATLDVQGTPRASLQRFGRKGGWVARFNRGSTATTKGPLVVVSTLDVFGDASGSKDDLRAYRAQFERAIADQNAQPVSVSDLGDEAVALTLVQPGAKPVRSFLIAWRERNATGSVIANGFEGRIQFGDVLRLARIQEARMSRA